MSVWRCQALVISRSPSSIGYDIPCQIQNLSNHLLTRVVVWTPAGPIYCVALTERSQDLPNRKHISATRKLSPVQAPGVACRSISKAWNTPKSRFNQNRQFACEYRLHRSDPSHAHSATLRLVSRQMPTIDRRANEGFACVALP